MVPRSAADLAGDEMLPLRLVIGAMCTGIVLVSAAAVFLVGGRQAGSAPQFATLLLRVQAALGIAGFVAFPYVRRAMIARLAGSGRWHDEDGNLSPVALQRTFGQVTIVGAAMAEGFGLFGLVIYFVTGSQLGLVGAAIALAVLVGFWPGERRWVRFLSDAAVAPATPG